MTTENSLGTQIQRKIKAKGSSGGYAVQVDCKLDQVTQHLAQVSFEIHRDEGFVLSGPPTPVFSQAYAEKLTLYS